MQRDPWSIQISHSNSHVETISTKSQTRVLSWLLPRREFFDSYLYANLLPAIRKTLEFTYWYVDIIVVVVYMRSERNLSRMSLQSGFST